MNFDVSSTLGYELNPGLTHTQQAPHRAVNRPCICQPLHIKCDPSLCTVAARMPIPTPARTFSENGYMPMTSSNGVMHARYARLQKSAYDGCPTCAIITDGLLTYGIYEKLNARFDTAVRVDRTGLVFVDSGVMVDENHKGDKLELIPDALQGDNFTCQAFALAKLPLQTTASSRSIQDLKTWILECTSEHEACGNGTPSVLPTRILDIGNEKVSLYESNPEEKHLYITLSYCWGWDGGVLKTTHSKLDTFHNEIPWDILPKTFQEAIGIARALQVRYLWIDALCIIQDDSEDCKKELGMMGNIYERSYLTIAASHSTDPSQGCFVNVKDDPQSRLKTIFGRKSPTEPIYEPDNPYARPSGYSVRYTLTHDKFRDRPSKYSQLGAKNIEPLNRRGWTFQERLLSKRIIHYTSQEMIWECETTMRCQCNRIEYVDQSLKVSVSESLRSQKSLLARWIRVIEEYTERDMTFESDRLPALLGVARQFEISGMGDYVAGTFTKYVVQLTSWKKRYVAGVLSCEVGVNATGYLGPSWSWISAKYPVTFHADIEFTDTSSRKAAIEVESVSWCSTSMMNAPVSRAQLVVRGPFFPATMYYGFLPDQKDDKNYQHLLIRRHGSRYSACDHIFSGSGISDDFTRFDRKWFVSATVYCMLWSIPNDFRNTTTSSEELENIAYFMLLEKFDDSKDQGGSYYQRLGMGYKRWKKSEREKPLGYAAWSITASELFQHAEEHTITLV